jgi:hypothetical protein
MSNDQIHIGNVGGGAAVAAGQNAQAIINQYIQQLVIQQPQPEPELPPSSGRVDIGVLYAAPLTYIEASGARHVLLCCSRSSRDSSARRDGAHWWWNWRNTRRRGAQRAWPPHAKC